MPCLVAPAWPLRVCLLSSKLILQVEKANDCIGEEVAQKAKDLKNGQVGMAEASAAILQ